MEIVLAAIAGTSIFLVVFALFGIRAVSPVQARLDQIGAGSVASIEEMELRQPLFDRTVRPLARYLARAARGLASPQRVSRTEERLIMAGNPGSLRSADFLGLKVLSAAGIGLLALLVALVATQNVGIAAIVAAFGLVLGFILPEFWLGSRIGRRRHRILRLLPDTLDLLTISVQAGLGFDAALAKVVEKTTGPLAEEFRRALAEVRVGRTRRDALRDMAARNQVQSLTNFISAIIQAEQLGVPISRVLQVQSEQLRIERRQRAEEMANKAPIKMLFPLIGCIFPSLFIVILGPALITLSVNMGRGR